MKAATILFTLLLLPTISFADSNQESNQTGEILQEHDASKVDSYPATQDSVLAYFKVLEDRVTQAASGSVPASIPALADNEELFLNSTYLYCTINKGTCPTVLDAILEADVINARLSKQASCPNLKLFWKLWVRNDMEKRQNYSVKTGFLGDTDAFKKNVRPRYIKCEETVSAAISGSGSDAEFFKARYSGDSAALKSTQRMSKLLAEIKAKVPNIMSAVGVR